MANLDASVETKTGVRKPFPFLNGIRQFAIDELLLRKKTYPVPISSPFVRMTSTKEDSEIGYRFFTLGLHGFNTSLDNAFDLTYGREGDLVGYAYSTKETNSGTNKSRKRFIYASDLTLQTPQPEIQDSVNNTNSLVDIQKQRAKEQSNIASFGTQPVPGIVDVKISRRGLGTPINARVKWVCYNRAQLEFLRNHFMIAGTYVVLEWGQQFSDRTFSNLLDFGDSNNILTDLKQCLQKGRNYIIDTYVYPNEGNYDLMVGVVGNSEIEFDAVTNVYTITTIIYSVGEQYWGISSHTTFIDHVNDSSEGRVTTIADFFVPDNSEFSRLCEDPAAKKLGLVADFKSRSSPEAISTSKDIGNIGNNPNDYKFIRWDYFTGTVLNALYDKIGSSDIGSVVKKFINFSESQSLAENSVSSNTKLPNTSYVGDSPYLVSTRPETMIIIRSNSNKIPEFQSSGYFGNNTFGILGKGVWINAGAIKRSFAATTTFDAGMRNLLIEMNLATAGFWSLRLFYDEDDASLKIIDEKFGTLDNLPSIYKFNVGGIGETISLSLTTAYPPELTTQLSLIASFKSKTKQEREALLKRYPLIGTTSHFAFALNWTNLTDVLEATLKAPAPTSSSLPGSTSEPSKGTIAQSLNSTPTTEIPSRDRLVGGDRTQINLMQNSENRAVNAPLSQGGIIAASGIPGDRNENSKLQTSNFIPGQYGLQLSQVDNQLINKSQTYDTSIKKWSQIYNLDYSLLKAIIAAESDYDASATRKESQLDASLRKANRFEDGASTSYGLTQILGDTARSLGYDGTFDDLKTDTDKQIELGAKLLRSNLDRTDDDEDAAISAYNGGFRQEYGFGSRFSGWEGEHAPCLRWESGKCAEYGVVVIGQFGNQSYVNKVKNLKNKFVRMADIQAQSDATSTINTQKDPKNNVVSQQSIQDKNTTSQRQSLEQSQVLTREEEIRQKFGASILEVIEPNTSELMRKIVREGLVRTPYPSNNFVAPFPTSAKVSVTILGLAGISVSDTFLVDKLPFIYEEYGAFQVFEIQESITNEGWFTKIDGVFKLLWLDGRGSLDKNRITVIY